MVKHEFQDAGFLAACKVEPYFRCRPNCEAKGGASTIFAMIYAKCSVLPYEERSFVWMRAV